MYYVSADEVCYVASTYYERLGEYLPTPAYVSKSVCTLQPVVQPVEQPVVERVVKYRSVAT